MEFSNDILIRAVILVLGVCGFLVAKHIRNHKVKNAPLVCMVGFDCHTVVNSDYSKFMGIPVEIFGMIYYAFISVFYLIFIFVPMPDIWSLDLNFVLFVVSFIAFLFSLYLIGVQIFVLKKGCSWCIVSAFICLLIFIATVFTYDFSSIAQIFLK